MWVSKKAKSNVMGFSGGIEGNYIGWTGGLISWHLMMGTSLLSSSSHFFMSQLCRIYYVTDCVIMKYKHYYCYLDNYDYYNDDSYLMLKRPWLIISWKRWLVGGELGTQNNLGKQRIPRWFIRWFVTKILLWIKTSCHPLNLPHS